MPSDAAFGSVVTGFLLVLTRVGAFFVFIPLPGSRAFLAMPKVVLTLSVALMLFRFWPITPGIATSFPSLIVAIASEAGLGIAAGTGVALMIEAMQLAAQFIALQAGFSYASTIDPTSEADSGLLLIICQLLTSLIFFAIGLDRQILGALANSFERIPAGSYHLTNSSAIAILGIGSTMFQIALRLAMPVIAMLLIADISLALLGKVEQHLQLSSLLFPLKTLAAMAILAIVMPGSARLIEQWLSNGWRTVYQAVGF
jgi:flagellar biosynthetic protein FliR